MRIENLAVQAAVLDRYQLLNQAGEVSSSHMRQSQARRTLRKYLNVPVGSPLRTVRTKLSSGFSSPGNSGPKLSLWIVWLTFKSAWS